MRLEAVKTKDGLDQSAFKQFFSSIFTLLTSLISTAADTHTAGFKF